jgi:transposase
MKEQNLHNDYQRPERFLVQNIDLLNLPGWVVRSVHEEVEEVPLICPLCGSTRPPYHFGYRPRTLFDLPIRMKPVQLLARRRRYRCRDCGNTFLDATPSLSQAHDATERLISYIEHALQLTCTFTVLAHDLGVSEKFVRTVFQAHISHLERDYVIQTPRYLGIDEIYIEDAPYCVLTDLERRCVIDLLAKRDMESVKRWLTQLVSPEKVEAVAMDLWNPYRLAVREVLPQALIVADKYHVLCLANDVVEVVRKSIRATLTPAQQKQLKQDRKILLKRGRDLTPHQRMILESWPGFVPLLNDLYRLKEEFFAIYDAGCEQDAYERYLAWQHHIPPPLAEAFLSLQLTVESWGDEIFAFFHIDVPLTNAFTERANLSIREATRVTFGLTFRTLRAKLLFCPSNLAARTQKARDLQPHEVGAPS